jgi:hypothetical protein
MYGLVNRAVQGLITAQFGADTWNQIAQKLKLPACPFLSMRPYPDDLTYQLVAAVSEQLQTPADQVLEVFGEHWILFTAKEGYGSLLDHCGETLREFLLNIDSLHTRVGLIFPDLRPPEFRTSEQPDGSVRLEYCSTRQGLTPMIVGLLKGLAKRFNEPVSIAQVECDDHSRCQAAFVISWEH